MARHKLKPNYNKEEVNKELIDKKGYYYGLVNAQYMTYQKNAEDDLD